MSTTAGGAVPRETSVTVRCSESVLAVTKRPDREDERELHKVWLVCRCAEDGTLELLKILVANANDPSLLYVREMSRNDFQTLKDEQDILVDFNNFPENLILLLEKCIKSKTEEMPSFQAVLTLSEGCSKLQIIEASNFRKLPHVTLKLSPGDDTGIKQFLLLSLSESKNRICELEKELEGSKAQKEIAQSELLEMQGKLDRLSMSSQNELGAGHPPVVREGSDAMTQLDHLKSQNEAVTSRNAESEKEELVAKVASLERRLAVAEQQQTTHEDECVGLRKRSQLLLDGKRELELQVDDLRVSRDGLEQEVLKHSESLDQYRQQIASLEASNEELQSRCRGLMQKVAEAEEKAKKFENDKIKNEQIIEKFASDLQASKEKTKKKQAMLLRQDEQVHHLQDRLQEAERRRDQIQTEYDNLQREALQQEPTIQEFSSMQGLHSNQVGNKYAPVPMYQHYHQWDRGLPQSHTYHVGPQPHTMQQQPPYMPYRNRRHAGQEQRQSGSQEFELRYNALRE